jgi:hypothetical protein
MEFVKNPYCPASTGPITILVEANSAHVPFPFAKAPHEGEVMGVPELAAGTVSAIVVAAFTTYAMRPFWRRRAQLRLRTLLTRFGWQREQLEARFFDVAAGESEPIGWRWETIDFAQSVSFARDRSTGRLSALVEVEIGLVPRHAPPLPYGESPPRRQHATAVFQVSRGRWVTKGRLLDNMSPREALHRFPDRYEALPQPTSR